MRSHQHAPRRVTAATSTSRASGSALRCAASLFLPTGKSQTSPNVSGDEDVVETFYRPSSSAASGRRPEAGCSPSRLAPARRQKGRSQGVGSLATSFSARGARGSDAFRKSGGARDRCCAAHVRRRRGCRLADGSGRRQQGRRHGDALGVHAGLGARRISSCRRPQIERTRKERTSPSPASRLENGAVKRATK